MANRSEVKICTTKEGLNVMKSFVQERIKDCKDKTIDNLLDKLDENLIQEENFVIIGWKSIKWYEGLYLDVDAIVDSLNNLEKQDIPYQFIRVGEDIGDVTQRDNIEDDYFPWMGVNTIICYEG